MGTTQIRIMSRFRIACFSLESWVDSNRYFRKPLESWAESESFPGKAVRVMSRFESMFSEAAWLMSWVETISGQTTWVVSWIENTHGVVFIPLGKIFPKAEKPFYLALSWFYFKKQYFGYFNYLNPRPDGPLGFPRPDGGLLRIPPLVTRLLEVVARNRKVRSKARRKSLRKYFGQFFVNVNIEVTRRH